jgi:hypothetical protein
MMYDSTCVIRRPRRAWPTPARTAAAIVATAALALLVAACSGSGSGGSSNAGGSTNSQALAFTHCMRSHGLRSFPDPNSHGVLPKVGPDQLGVSPSQFQAADRACAYLLQPNQAQVRQLMSGMRNFAQCMRSHGVRNWPDPTTDKNGQPVFDIPGIDPNSPQINTEANECWQQLHQITTGHPFTIELCDGVGEDGGCHGYGNPNS